MIAERPFTELALLHEQLSADIVSALSDAVDARGVASLVLTGGNTPADLYRRLARTNAPWPSISITLSDERWVQLQDDASNEGMVRRTLFAEGGARGAQFVSLRTGHARAAEAVEEVSEAVAAMPRPFDVCLLGIGEDGHFASLFPGEAMRRDVLVHAVHAPNAAGATERITLSMGAIASSRRIFLLFTGSAKLACYRAARDALSETPLAVLLEECRDRVTAYWCSDS
jgi:6-phosphogluconolactonase